MASMLRRISGSIRVSSDAGGLLHFEAAQRLLGIPQSTTTSPTKHALKTAPKGSRPYTVHAPGTQGERMASAMQSIDDLLGKIEYGKQTTGSSGTDLASLMRQFDGSTVLLQTGVLCANEKPITREAVAGIAPALRSDPITLQQAINVLSTTTLVGGYDVNLIAAVVDTAVPEIPSAQPKTIAALCYALGITGYSDHRLMRELEGVLEARQGDFDVESFAKVVWMLGRAHHKSGTALALVDKLAERALSKTVSPQEVVYAMWACAQYEVHMDELADHAASVVNGRVGELSGGELAKLACGLMEAEVRDEALFTQISTHGENIIDSMCPRDIAKLMYALGHVQAGDRKFVAVANPHVLANLDRFTYNELDMIVHAYNEWGIHDDTSTAVVQRMHREKGGVLS